MCICKSFTSIWYVNKVRTKILQGKPDAPVEIISSVSVIWKGMDLKALHGKAWCTCRSHLYTGKPDAPVEGPFYLCFSSTSGSQNGFSDLSLTFGSQLFWLPNKYVYFVEPVSSEKKTCICIQIVTLWSANKVWICSWSWNMCSYALNTWLCTMCSVSSLSSKLTPP